MVTLTETQNYCCGEVNSETQDVKLPQETKKIIDQFPEILQGLSKVKGAPIHIKMKENTTPFCLPVPRHIPIPMIKAVEKGIHWMEQLGVIKKDEYPNEWYQPTIVVVPKPSD